MESLVLTTGSGVGWYRVRRKYMVDISFRVEGAMTSLSMRISAMVVSDLVTCKF